MDDLISRQKAIDALMPIYKSASLRNRNVFSTAKKCMATIEELPSAQPDVHDRNVGEWDMFDLITSAYYGKMMYSKQDNGIVYSRYSCKCMSMDEAIREFLALIGEDI